jgi:hypothetical protein
MTNQASNGVPLSDNLHKKLEALLGRTIPLKQQGQVPTLTHFPELELKELQQLSGKHGGALPCIAYIRFRLAGRADLSLVTSFLENVLQQDISLEQWQHSVK